MAWSNLYLLIWIIEQCRISCALRWYYQNVQTHVAPTKFWHNQTSIILKACSTYFHLFIIFIYSFKLSLYRERQRKWTVLTFLPPKHTPEFLIQATFKATTCSTDLVCYTFKYKSEKCSLPINNYVSKGWSSSDFAHRETAQLWIDKDILLSKPHDTHVIAKVLL